MRPCLPEPPTKEIESEITESPASNTRRPADKNLGPMLPITKEILGDFYRPFNIKLAKVLRNDSFIWDNESKLHKPPPPFLSSTENHWCLSQWVSSLTSAHENQWFFIYFLIYKCRYESTVQNSTTERACVSKWECEMLEVCIFLITGWCTKLNSEFYDIETKLCVVFFYLIRIHPFPATQLN